MPRFSGDEVLLSGFERSVDVSLVVNELGLRAVAIHALIGLINLLWVLLIRLGFWLLRTCRRFRFVII